MNGYQLENPEILIQLLENNLNIKSNWWMHFHWQEIPFIRQKWNIMENLDILLEGYNTFILWVKLAFITQAIVYKPKLWHILFLVSKVSIDMFNIWLVFYSKAYFIILILMMAQISPALHGVGIKLKTKQPIII